MAIDVHRISREIGIDAGHRVTDHGSKCRNLHGHRYRIQAWCEGPLFNAGEQTGMVLDFGFLKEEMQNHIAEHFDHAFVFWVDDVLCRRMFGLEDDDFGKPIIDQVRTTGAFFGACSEGTKICVMPFVPTAEALAKYWYDTLSPFVAKRSNDQARLVNLKVWETPNCWASYGPVSD